MLGEDGFQWSSRELNLSSAIEFYDNADEIGNGFFELNNMTQDLLLQSNSNSPGIAWAIQTQSVSMFYASGRIIPQGDVFSLDFQGILKFTKSDECSPITFAIPIERNGSNPK